MKFKYAIVLTVCFTTLLFACKKQHDPEKKNLYGKWKLFEVYDDYSGGTPHTWHTVQGDSTFTVAFSTSGLYEKTDSARNLYQHCSGSYQFSSQNVINIQSTCDPTNESVTISELTNEFLIIDQKGTEGIIRYKYKAEK